MDSMPEWTIDQIAGLAFGFVMISFIGVAKQVDVYIAKAQRRQLGLCEECGGLNESSSCQKAECPMKQSSS